MTLLCPNGHDVKLNNEVTGEMYCFFAPLWFLLSSAFAISLSRAAR
jgi:hypothetical protein